MKPLFLNRFNPGAENCSADLAERFIDCTLPPPGVNRSLRLYPFSSLRIFGDPFESLFRPCSTEVQPPQGTRNEDHMAPRSKATENAEGGDQAAPRRSTRIAGIPPPAAAAAATKPAPKKTAAGSSKKRAVEDSDTKAESSAKKVCSRRVWVEEDVKAELVLLLGRRVRQTLLLK